MQRYVGTTAMGLRAPIVKKGEDLAEIVCDVVKNTVESNEIKLRDKDVIAVTESLLARSQGNYVDISAITKDLNNKFAKKIGIVYPITSRNRFSMILKACANTEKEINIFLNYPSDEVGNALFDESILYGSDVNIYSDTLTEEEYRKIAGDKSVHPFTGVDYVELYKSYAVNDNIKIYLSNNPSDIVEICDEILVANIHDRNYLTSLFKKLGAKTVYNLSHIMTESIDGSGYNPDYGLYGSNLASDHSIKLFPRDAQDFVEKVQKTLKDSYSKDIEVMVYGDGAFKDPVGKIWELADPVVSPGFTKGLEGTPNEIKIKYIADTKFDALKGEDAVKAIREEISQKESNLVGNNASLGTTPRRITDLLGSLSDLVSGSGDKGTPIVLIQGYFDNYADE